MKTYFLMLLVAASSFMGPHAAEAPGAVSGLMLELSFDQTAFRRGESIIAKVTLHNVSEHIIPLHYAAKTAESPIELIVNDQGAKKVEPIPADPILSGIASGRTLELLPGTNKEFVCDLRNRFDRKPGFYSVAAEVAARIGLSETNAYVRADGISIEIIGAERGQSVPTTPVSSALINTSIQQVNSYESIRRQSENGSHSTTALESRQMNTERVRGVVANAFTPVQKIGGVIIAGLVGLLFAILWRGSRRNKG